MSEQYFEILLTHVEADTDTHDAANKLSTLLKVDARQLEKVFVKVKVFDGSSQVLVSGIKKDKAIWYKKVLDNLGIVTTIQAEWALLPIEKNKDIEEFTCPACGAHQTVNTGKIHICSECGIVKDKYLSIQKRKKLEEERTQQIQELQKQAPFQKPQISIEEKNEEFLEKQFTKKIKKIKKKNNKGMNDGVVLASVFVGVIAMGIGGYIYLSNEKESADVSVNKSTEQQDERTVKDDGLMQESDLVQEDTAQKGNVIQKRAVVADTTMQRSGSPMSNGSGSVEEMMNELGNPYQKKLDQLGLKPIPKEKASTYVSTVLETKKDILTTDKSALNDISTLYDLAEQAPDKSMYLTEIKSKANTINNKTIRAEVIRQVAWGEVENEIKTFDQFGIYPIVLEGEDSRQVKLTNQLIELYVKNNEFEKAKELINQIDDYYLKAAAFKRVLDKLVHIDSVGANFQRDRIEIISHKNVLTDVQKPLVLGVLNLANTKLRDEDASKIAIKKALLAVYAIKDVTEQASTFIQLSDDQRVGLNLKNAHLFLENAHVIIESSKANFDDINKAYGVLAEQYVKLFEFERAKDLINKISDPTKILELVKMIRYVEEQSLL